MLEQKLCDALPVVRLKAADLLSVFYVNYVNCGLH